MIIAGLVLEILSVLGFPVAYGIYFHVNFGELGVGVMISSMLFFLFKELLSIIYIVGISLTLKRIKREDQNTTGVVNSPPSRFCCIKFNVVSARQLSIFNMILFGIATMVSGASLVSWIRHFQRQPCDDDFGCRPNLQGILLSYGLLAIPIIYWFGQSILVWVGLNERNRGMLMAGLVLEILSALLLSGPLIFVFPIFDILVMWLHGFGIVIFWCIVLYIKEISSILYIVCTYRAMEEIKCEDQNATAGPGADMEEAIPMQQTVFVAQQQPYYVPAKVCIVLKIKSNKLFPIFLYFS